MIRTICLCALCLVECILACASAQEPERPGQEACIKRAVFARQRLWLLSDAGALSSIVDKGDERMVEHLPEPVLDLCVQNGDPLIVTGLVVTEIHRRRSVSGTVPMLVPR